MEEFPEQLQQLLPHDFVQAIAGFRLIKGDQRDAVTHFAVQGVMENPCFKF